MPSIAKPQVTTALGLPGFLVVRHLGVVRGLVVRSRSIIGNIGASFQSLLGGNITLYTQLCEQARDEAFSLMCAHASALGANAVVAMRYDATEVSPGITEVLAYGTAVVVEPLFAGDSSAHMGIGGVLEDAAAPPSFLPGTASPASTVRFPGRQG